MHPGSYRPRSVSGPFKLLLALIPLGSVEKVATQNLVVQQIRSAVVAFTIPSPQLTSVVLKSRRAG